MAVTLSAVVCQWVNDIALLQLTLLGYVIVYSILCKQTEVQSIVWI